MVHEALTMMQSLCAGDYEPLQFSIDMENYLYENYDDMCRENQELTEFLNEDVPELCAECEPGMDFRDFVSAISARLDEANKYLS